MTTTELLALRTRQIEKRPEDLAYAAEILEKACLQSKPQFNQRYARRLQKHTYKEGDLVLVRNTHLEMTVTKFKTDPRYIGPYEIVRRTPRGNYVSKELDGTIHAQPYAAFRIITYIRQNFPWLHVPNSGHNAGPENEELNSDETIDNPEKEID
jgi:hypothetical protein